MLAIWSSPATPLGVSNAGSWGWQGNAEVQQSNAITVSGLWGWQGGSSVIVTEQIAVSGSWGWQGRVGLDNTSVKAFADGRWGWQGRAALSITSELFLTCSWGWQGGAELHLQKIIPELSCLAIQGAVGDIGRKAVTLIPGYGFNSLGEINGVRIGASDTGLHKLDSGDLLNSTEFERSFSLKKTDLGYPQNLKKMLYVYVTCDGDISKMSVHLKADDGDWYAFHRCHAWGRGFRAAVGTPTQGIYWTLKVSSTGWFRVDTVQVRFVVRSSGIQKIG